jgi:YidC/Oxa1 family membrane protein insertase
MLRRATEEARMDERRALLAVVLIFVVLFGYNYFMSKTAPAPVASPEQTAERPGDVGGGEGGAEGTPASDAGARPVPEGAPPASTDDVGAPVAVEGVPVGASLPERTIVVDAPLWVATFSTRGAAVTSWRLKGYAAVSGQAVDLVPAGTQGLPVEIRYGPSTVSSALWNFAYEGPERIVLSENGGPVTVRFEATGSDGIDVAKEYVLVPGGYAFGLGVEVRGLVEPGARRELWIGWPGVIPSEQKEDDNAIATVALVDGKAVRTRFGSLRKGGTREESGTIGWATSQSQYFVAAVMPENASFVGTEATADADARIIGFKAGLPVDGAALAAKFAVYAGPQDYYALREMGGHLEWAIDLGWAIFRPLCVATLVALLWAHRFIPNYGIVIIIISILTKLLFYRLTHKSFTEMKRMQDLQPKLQDLKTKLGGDREALARAQMELYKKEGVNPMGSCLPMLLQMPVFIALYQVLRTTIELRGAPFALWITDLSKPDTVATIAGFPIHVLPLLMGVAMLAQQRMSSKDPSQALVNNLMPIVFTALFYNFASGLVIYWLVNTVASVAQQFYIQRGAVAAKISDAATPDGILAQSSLPSAGDLSVTDADVVDSEHGRAPTRNRAARRRRRK